MPLSIAQTAVTKYATTVKIIKKEIVLKYKLILPFLIANTSIKIIKIALKKHDINSLNPPMSKIDIIILTEEKLKFAFNLFIIFVIVTPHLPLPLILATHIKKAF